MKREASDDQQYRERLLAILQEIPVIRLERAPKKKRLLQGVEPDLTVDLRLGEEAWEILGETKASGEPRMVRAAIQQLQSYLSSLPRRYGVVFAPYLASRSQEICRAAGVGYLDLAGNCRLMFGPVYIERKGFPNLKAERRPLRTLFAPRASRVLRVLLADPKRAFQVQQMARASKVSLGLAFKVKQRLLDLDYAQEEQGGLRLSRPEELLREWATNYVFSKNPALDCYAANEVSELEHELARYCFDKKVVYAFTLFSGAARVAPFTRYTRGWAYVMTDLQEITQGLGWKPVPTGANFTLLRPLDEGLLDGLQEVGGEKVVSDVQLYLDLMGHRGRGEEAATFLLEQKLRPQW